LIISANKVLAGRLGLLSQLASQLIIMLLYDTLRDLLGLHGKRLLLVCPMINAIKITPPLVSSAAPLTINTLPRSSTLPTPPCPSLSDSSDWPLSVQQISRIDDLHELLDCSEQFIERSIQKSEEAQDQCAEEVAYLWQHLATYEGLNPQHSTYIQQWRTAISDRLPILDRITRSMNLCRRRRQCEEQIENAWGSRLDHILGALRPANGWPKNVIEALASMSRRIPREQAQTLLAVQVNVRVNKPYADSRRGKRRDARLFPDDIKAVERQWKSLQEQEQMAAGAKTMGEEQQDLKKGVLEEGLHSDEHNHEEELKSKYEHSHKEEQHHEEEQNLEKLEQKDQEQGQCKSNAEEEPWDCKRAHLADRGQVNGITSRKRRKVAGHDDRLFQPLHPVKANGKVADSSEHDVDKSLSELSVELGRGCPNDQEMTRPTEFSSPAISTLSSVSHSPSSPGFPSLSFTPFPQLEQERTAPVLKDITAHLDLNAALIPKRQLFPQTLDDYQQSGPTTHRSERTGLQSQCNGGLPTPISPGSDVQIVSATTEASPSPGPHLKLEMGLPSTDSDGALSTLHPGRMLSGTVIDICLALLSACACLEATTHLYSNTVLESHENRVKPLEPNINTVFIPIHHSIRHWTLSEFGLAQRTIYHYDSLPGDKTDILSATFTRLKAFLSRMDLSDDGWTFSSHDTPRQSNSYDCGIHVLITLFYRVCNIIPPAAQDCKLWRSILYALLAKEVRKPPSSDPEELNISIVNIPHQALYSGISSQWESQIQSNFCLLQTFQASQHRIQSAKERLASAISAQLVLDTLQANCEARIYLADTSRVESDIACLDSQIELSKSLSTVETSELLKHLHGLRGTADRRKIKSEALQTKLEDHLRGITAATQLIEGVIATERASIKEAKDTGEKIALELQSYAGALAGIAEQIRAGAGHNE